MEHSIGFKAGLALVLAGVVLSGCGAPPPANGDARPVMVVQPHSAQAQASVFPGEVRARHEVPLAFRVGGEVVRRMVEVGDAVADGRVLAELDPSDTGLQVDAARARLESAQADAAVALAERDRYAALAQQQLVSRSMLDNAENALAGAQARLDQARADLEVSRNQSGYTTLRAPGAGVVAERHVEAGQVVAAGQVAFMLAMDGEREVLIAVPEQRRDAFEPGRQVQVELWSRPGEPVPGEVRERAPSADPGARTYAVRVAFDAQAVGADLGQSARVYAEDSGDAMLALPLSAVSAEGGQAFVWRLDPGTATVQRQPVEVAAFGDTQVRIARGIGPQDWVVRAGVHLLRDGQRVHAVDRDNRVLVIDPPLTP